MNRIRTLLQHIGVLAHFTEEDVHNAAVDDKFYDQQKASADVSAAVRSSRTSRRCLRNAIEEANKRAAPYVNERRA